MINIITYLKHISEIGFLNLDILRYQYSKLFKKKWLSLLKGDSQISFIKNEIVEISFIHNLLFNILYEKHRKLVEW